MAVITLTPVDVKLMRFSAHMSKEMRIADVALTRGQIVRENSSGEWVLAAGDSAGNAAGPLYMVLDTVAAGQPVTGVRNCLVNLGASVFDSANPKAPVYLADTPGALSLTAGDSTTTTIIGYVHAVWHAGSTTPDKVLRLVAGT